MDSVDHKIIALLKQNARMSASDIAKKIHLSVPAVSERLRKLNKSGAIEQYTIRLNRKKMNLNLVAYIQLIIEQKAYQEEFKGRLLAFKEAIESSKNVLECYHTAGEYDFMIKVQAADTQGLEDFIINDLKRIPGIIRTNTIITLGTVKE